MNIRYFIVHNLNEKNRKSSTQYYAAISPSNSLGTVTSKLLVFNLHLHANQIKHVIRSIYNFHHDSRLLTFQPNSDKRFRHRHQRCCNKSKEQTHQNPFLFEWFTCPDNILHECVVKGVENRWRVAEIDTSAGYWEEYEFFCNFNKPKNNTNCFSSLQF